MTEDQLLKLKKQVDAAKITVAELEGQQKAQLKQLKEEWECSSIEEAEKKLKTFDKEIEKLTEQIETQLEELEELYTQ